MAQSIFINHLWHKVKARSRLRMVLWGIGCGRSVPPGRCHTDLRGWRPRPQPYRGSMVFRFGFFLCSFSVLIQIIYSRINKTQLWAKFNLCLPAGSSHLPGRLREDRTRPKGVRQGQRGHATTTLTAGFSPLKSPFKSSPEALSLLFSLKSITKSVHSLYL